MDKLVIYLNTEILTVQTFLIILIVTTILGGLLGGLLAFLRRKEGYDRSFFITIVLMPLIISIIILLVSNSIARAFSLAGVFTLVKFRTTISDTKDIAYVFSTVAIGLAMGMGYVTFAFIITLFIMAILALIALFKLDEIKDNHAKLKIVIPENLNYIGAFDEVFGTYLQFYKLKKVRTTDFGSTFELTYLINMKKSINQKAFIDDLRVINNNLNIVLNQEYVERAVE
jgi:MFS family permease